MPLIKPRVNRVRSVRHISRPAETESRRARACARFIGHTPDYVLDQLIDTTIAKDRDFVVWRAEQPANALTIPKARDSRVEDGR